MSGGGMGADMDLAIEAMATAAAEAAGGGGWMRGMMTRCWLRRQLASL